MAKLGRHFCGIEQDPEYVDLARRRIEATQALDSMDILEAPTKRAEPRIPFGNLIERGLVTPGSEVVGKGGRMYGQGWYRRHDHSRPWSRFHPPDWRESSGRTKLQRLDILACSAGGEITAS